MFFGGYKKVFSVNNPKCMVTVHELGEGRFGVTVNSYAGDKVTFALDSFCQIEKVVNGTVKRNVLTLKNGFAYLEISR